MSWKNFTRTTGIYSITNKTNNRKYIGQSKDIGSRWKQHLYQLKRNTHHCQALQEDWNQYSYEDFVFQVELICTKKYLSEKEIEIWDKYENNYNGRPTGQVYPEPTKETRQKLSKAKIGKVRSKEHRESLSKVNKGKILSEEHKRKISESLKGKSPSAETRQKLSETFKGRTFSEETRQKLSKSLTGRTLSEEHKRKKSEAMKEYYRKKKENT